MDYFKDVPGMQEQVKAKKVKFMFQVWPEGMKPKTYKDLNQMAKDFTEDELNRGKGAAINLIANATVVGRLDTQRILDEIF